VLVDSLLERAGSAEEALARAGELLDAAALELGRGLAGAGAE
jgi:hypothetical protein